MDQYEKLYAAIDKAFAGTPNTPAALAAKAEIIENLTAKYDDLRAEGVSEDEAICKAVDSIGEVSELFGKAPAHSEDGSRGGGEVQAPVPMSAPAPVEVSYPANAVRRGKLMKKTLIALAVALYVLSPMGPILSVAGVPEPLAVSLLFVLSGLATAMIVGSGFCLPWNNAKGKVMLGLGVGGCVWGLIPAILLGETAEVLSLSLMFGIWAVSVVLIVLSTSFKGAVPPKEEEEGEKQSAARRSEVPEDLMSVYKPIQTVLALVTLAVYLGISFRTFGWIYTWLIWPMYGCVCRIVQAFFWLGRQNHKEEKS